MIVVSDMGHCWSNQAPAAVKHIFVARASMGMCRTEVAVKMPQPHFPIVHRDRTIEIHSIGTRANPLDDFTMKALLPTYRVATSQSMDPSVVEIHVDGVECGWSENDKQ